ncbi:DUF2145 domain-containing protein [Solimonas sp. K1W22B-7]|uniref:DUF2145 domain-containing protein n=1 Tax=Solimonas sp. K1W22B-7 TaxID=2303331 RepID=UPI000E3327F9|nr:DUF2145 domain-containing protein [Solimonas sp. K1W22B-7]AXQ28685.1 DUF2145 domain-containing protein [Solimonas sp. K1W22B-7]
MNAPMRGIATLLLAALVAVSSLAQAGQGCQATPVTPAAMGKAMHLAQQVQAALDQRQAQVAILGRVGSDVSKYGLRYTHAGIAYRAPGEAGWTILHKLNHCGEDRASLFRDGLMNFFLDDPLEYRALLLFPTEALQRHLAPAAAGDLGLGMDNPHYSVLAYPFALDYQNSNSWLLEFLVAAGSEVPVIGRAAAQTQLRRSGYKPDRISIAPSERIGATLFKANVAFTDHPLGERLSGKYSVVTVESIARYLGERQWLAESRELSLQP